MGAEQAEKVRFGRYSSFIANLLLKLQDKIHWRLIYWFTCLFLWVMSQFEKLWFLYYVYRKKNYWETIRRIRKNRFCPTTVETIYEFYTRESTHEAFRGLKR